jgi:O-antigen/teichoic acid export membrane protein
VPVGIIKSTTLGVVFSTLSKLQNDKEIFEQYYIRILNVFVVLLGLITCFIFVYAENIILLLYGEKWIKAVFYMQLLTLASFFYIGETLNRNIFKVFDQTSKILFLEIVKKTIQTITLVLGILLINLDVLMYGFLLTNVVSYFLLLYSFRVTNIITESQKVLKLIKSRNI